MIRKVGYIVIIGIGLLQTIGYLTNAPALRNLGVVSSASPLPIVFTEVKGVETFASDFYMQWENDQHYLESIKITPELYARFKGPYNRRNIYGAAISYGPVLPEKVWKPILDYGLCNNILEDELQIPIGKVNFSIKIKTRTQGKSDEWILKSSCQ